MIYKSHASTISVGLPLLISLVIASAAQAEPQTAQPESSYAAIKQQTDLITPIVSQLTPATQKLITRGPDNTFSVSKEVANKEAVLKEIEQAFSASSNRKKLAAQKQKSVTPCIGLLCGYRSESRNTKENILDGYVQVEDFFHSVGDAPDPFTVRVKLEGHQHSTWFGTKPIRADSIVVDTSITVDGFSLSLSLPPGMIIKDRRAGYVSQSFPNAWLASYSYDNLIVTSNFAITGFHQLSSGSFRFGSSEYQIFTGNISI